MYRKTELQSLAEGKAEDALLLYKSKRYSNAYYLAGYTIELALKAVAAVQFQSDVIPDKAFVQDLYTHRLSRLVGLAGLSRDLKDRRNESAVFDANWAITSKWEENSRYRSWDSFEATSLLTAVLNEKEGVLPWVKTFW